MTWNTARAVLRLIALTTMLVGACLTVQTVVALAAAQGMAQQTFGGLEVQFGRTMAQAGTFAFLGSASTIGVGIVFYMLSGWLASRVVE